MYGNKIRMIRLSRGLSQEAAAERLGTSQNAYSKIENNQKKLSDSDITKLAEVFGVNAEDIKSIEPIILNFHHSPQSNGINHGQITPINDALLQQLTKQLEVKDKQLGQANEQILLLTSMLQKKING